MVGSKADCGYARRPRDDPAGGLQVGQGQAGDRLVAEVVESLGGHPQRPGDVCRLLEGLQAFEPLPDAAAEPPGHRKADFGVESVEFAELGFPLGLRLFQDGLLGDLLLDA